MALQRDCATLIIIAYVRASGVSEQRFSAFQLIGQFREKREQRVLVKAHFAFVVPHFWEVNTALEVGYADDGIFL